MDYLHRVLLKNSYPDWIIDNLEKETNNSYWKSSISVPYVPGHREEFRRMLWHTSVQDIFKGTNTLESILMHPKDKIPSHLKQNIVYKWSCPYENCNLSYIGESSWWLENRIMEQSSHRFSAFYQHSVSSNHPKANISHFKIIDQDGKQVAREATEAIHIRINNPAINHNMGKMYIP